MSVILTLEDFGASQGWSGEGYRTLTNSGTENVRNIQLKVLDSAVFTVLAVAAENGAVHQETCLNVFNADDIKNYTDGNKNFPGSTTKNIYMYYTVKGDAPIQVNDLVCYWQYEIY
jgi:hypothetical protein